MSFLHNIVAMVIAVAIFLWLLFSAVEVFDSIVVMIFAVGIVAVVMVQLLKLLLKLIVIVIGAVLI